MKPFQGTDCILMYHSTPRSEAARLARQLRAVAFFFDIVPLEALRERTPRARNRRRVALTFDDGLRNNVSVVYPILRALGLPATFFVCPGLVSCGAWLWNHEARQRLYALPGNDFQRLAAAMAAPGEVEAFVTWMKSLRLGERRRVEQAIRDATPGFVPSAEEREQFDLATWEQLKSLDPRIVTIGSHTLTHPILTSLTADEMEAELAGSRRLLEAELGREVPAFCYPNGDLDDAVLGAARRHYGCAVAVDERSLRGDVDPHRLPRLAASPDQSLRLARTLAFA